MVARPAARITDMTMHLLPGVLVPGLPSLNVIIGFLPAWKGAPGGAGASLKDDKNASDDRIRKATAACALAGNTPAAKTALEAVKIKEAAEMTKKILDAASSGASIHACISIAPVPVGVPHGPGLVIDGSPTVLINKLPACRMGDEILEAFGPKNFIAFGQVNVLIGNKGTSAGSPAAVAEAIAAIAKLMNSAARLAQLLAGIFNTNPSQAIAQLLTTLGAIHAMADRLRKLLGLDGIKPSVSRIVETIRREVNEILDGVVRAVGAAAEGPADAAGGIVSDIAKGMGKAAKAFQKGLEDAARKELENLRKQERGAQKFYDWGSKKVDEMAEQDGPIGDLAREVQERRDALEAKKRGAENLASDPAGAVKRGIEKAQAAEKKARETAQAARRAAEETAEAAARTIGGLVQGFADGLDGTPEAPHDHHDHPEATH